MEAYVYCWTDWSNQKLYVGWHKGSLDDGYVCSSKIMLEEYYKRPKDFTKQIIATGSAENMSAFETILLQTVNAKENSTFYNMHNGNGLYFLKGHTEKSKKKISLAKTGVARPDLVKRNKSENNPAKLGLCSRDMQGEKNPMYGKKHSEDTKLKISHAKKGKNTHPKSEETKRKMTAARKMYWMKKKGEI